MIKKTKEKEAKKNPAAAKVKSETKAKPKTGVRTKKKF